MLKRLVVVVLALVCLGTQIVAQDTPNGDTEAGTDLGPMQQVLQDNAEIIVESSRRTIQPAIDAVANSGLEAAPVVLGTWQDRDMWQRVSDGLFFKVEKSGSDYELTDFDTGEVVATVTKDDIEQIKPNSGIRGLIATALVTFQLNDPDPAKRREALDSLERNANADLLGPLRDSIETEDDPSIRARKERLEKLITITYGDDPEARIAAIEAMSGDLGVDVRSLPIRLTR